ncbi:glycoside hydrolase family 26 protein [Polychaeton citri CBS 116435]|uniref:Glycoside hydrolase family 26 protein n=1 Tax=Polychaeton citri CBS 116435 TaxID=1314669 RepID=A0A9P4UL13_9PEZI|nr:glycoside hydrolase family 26 protein [Polychaeton citri CBS 116435]
MKYITLTTLALSATGALARNNPTGEAYGIKSDSMISYENVYFGYAPNYNPRVTLAGLNKQTGQKGATYNVYSQLTSSNVNSGSYNGNDQYPVDDIIDSGAVLIASLMTEIHWYQVTEGLCESVAKYFENTFTSKGVTVWLRFAHEMNYYADPKGGQQIYPGGQNYDGFKQAWQTMYNAVSGNSKIYMYWSPNVDDSGEPVAPWWPGAGQVDIVGMDLYPNANNGLPTFAQAYGKFYSTYASANNIPFAIGETGCQAGGGTCSIDQREAWLKAIINPSGGFGADFHLYMSCTWFEYGPPTNGDNFYVVYGQSSATVDRTISNTEGGS